jgi:DNA-binding transcriptional LysR family regulator
MTPALELRHFRYFIAAAEELNFARAAERLGLAQPSLSLQIQALERLTGATLFHRRPRVRLTEAGEALLVQARRTLAQAEEALEAARRAARGELGVLTLGVVPSTLLVASLTQSIRRFRELHPGVEVRLVEMSTTEQMTALGMERIDAGLLRQPSRDSPFACEVVAEEPLLAVLPAAHRLARRRTLPLSLLAEESFVFFPRVVNPPLYDHLTSIFRRSGFIPRVVQEASEFQSCVSLVEAGFGVSVVPAGVGSIAVPGVVYRPIRAKDGLTAVALCWRQHDSSPRVTALLELMRRSGV